MYCQYCNIALLCSTIYWYVYSDTWWGKYWQMASRQYMYVSYGARGYWKGNLDGLLAKRQICQFFAHVNKLCYVTCNNQCCKHLHAKILQYWAHNISYTFTFISLFSLSNSHYTLLYLTYSSFNGFNDDFQASISFGKSSACLEHT